MPRAWALGGGLVADDRKGKTVVAGTGNVESPHAGGRPRIRVTGQRHQRRLDRFINFLAQLPNVSAACRAVGMAPSTAYAARARDPQFKRRWQEAIQEGADCIEYEIWRRAVEGVERVRPIYYEGREVGRVVWREYSDVLILALIRSYRAEWRPRYQEATPPTWPAKPSPAVPFDWERFFELFRPEAMGEPAPLPLPSDTQEEPS